MNRLLFAFMLLASIKGDAVECDYTGIPVDKYGCVGLGIYKLAEKEKCSNMPKCFKIGVEADPQKDLLEIPEQPKIYFKQEQPEEKKKITNILDSSAVALLKNMKLKGIKIIFYNKDGKLSNDFQKDAERYLLDKGVKAEQFKIEIRN
jgi:hypothetical protein